MNKLLLPIIAVATVLIIGFVAYNAMNNNSSQSLENLNIQDVNVEVARVNGVSITRGELNNQMSQLMQNPQFQIPEGDADAQKEFEKFALDQIINSQLLAEAAESQDIIISDEEIESEVDDLRSQFESPEALEAQLAQIGMTDESLREEIRSQLVFDRYYNRLVEENNITVSNDEIQTYYDEQLAGQEEAPALSDVETQIEAQLQQEKMQPILAAVIEDLRAAASVEIFI